MSDALLSPGAEFYGAVVMKEWIFDLVTGKAARSVVGMVSVVQDEAAIGFRTKGTESNWLCRVRGETQTYNILGCQIRGVVQLADGDDPVGEVMVVA